MKWLLGLIVVWLAGCNPPQSPSSTPSTPAESITENSVSKKSSLSPPAKGDALASHTTFDDYPKGQARAAAMFKEMAKVFQHPRCVNCHPAGDAPLQGDDMRPHHPMVVRGDKGQGAPGMACGTCHGSANFRRVPGAPAWHLAPSSMAWEGLSAREICEQLKDPERNGGLDLAALVKHGSEDSLVAWGWDPPKHLEPVPGDQADFAALTRAWVAEGAHCPPPAPSPGTP